MKKAVWSGIATAAAVLMFSTSAYAQTTLTNANINATANVAARARLTLTGPIAFNDADPDLVPLIDATNPLDVQAQARVSPGTIVNLTVQAGGDFVSGGDSIAINNMTWISSSAGFNATGTMSSGTAQSVASWTGPGTRNGSQTYRLANSWNYPPGTYSVTLTYTLATP